MFHAAPHFPVFDDKSQRLGQPDQHQQTCGLGGQKADVAAVAANDIAGDGQPQSGSAGLSIARVVETLKRREGAFDLLRRNSRSVVPDGNDNRLRLVAEGNGDALAVSASIVDQVRKSAAHRDRLAGQRRVIWALVVDLTTEVGEIVAKADQERSDVDRAMRFALHFLAREGEG